MINWLVTEFVRLMPMSREACGRVMHVMAMGGEYEMPTPKTIKLRMMMGIRMRDPYDLAGIRPEIEVWSDAIVTRDSRASRIVSYVKPWNLRRRRRCR